MKKLFLPLILLLLFATILFVAGCKETKTAPVTISFASGTSESIADVTTDLSAAASLALPKPSREVFLSERADPDTWYFDGWFFENDYQTPYSPTLLKEKVKDGKVTLYAKWEIYMQINGKIDCKAVLNPSFGWKNEFGDEAFGVVLKDAENNTLFRDETSTPAYTVPETLAFGKTYTIVVAGLTSNRTLSATFQTIEGEGTPDYQSATFSVCEPFKSHMVLQRGKPIEIHGTAAPRALVTAVFYGAEYLTIADAEGAFSFTFPAMQAQTTPTDVEFRMLKNKKVVLSDVLVGDVFLVSGQSNVQWCLKDSDYEEADVDNAIAHDVRYYSMSTSSAATPIETIKDGKWFKISKLNLGFTWYSAIAFMVGSMLGTALAETGVPIGVVCASQGDTNIKSWMDESYYEGTLAAEKRHYNAMIYPLRNANYSGVIWYQGCNNSSKGIDYKEHLKNLFANWRALFRNAELPFYVVQLPVFDGDSGNNYDFSFVRESQYLACEEDANAYLIATCDGGDPTYIHPREKRYIAERLTKSLLSTVYGRSYLPQGPTYLSHAFDGSAAVVSVKNGDGLTSKGDIVGFELAGTDGKYFPASAAIENGKIRVTSDKVSAPAFIRYGFSKSPFLNVYNKDGYLMSPFRTDRYNRGIDLLDYTDGAPYAAGGGSAIEREVVSVGGKTGLRLTKANDGKGYGILQLPKWGAIGYEENAIEIRAIGSNSGAKILFRIRENSYEIWACSFTDDFTGEKVFTIPTSEFTCVDNPSDGVIDYQAVRNVDVVIEKDGAASVTLLGVRFVDE